MIRAALVAQLERNRVGARPQRHRNAATAKGVVAAEVDNLLVHAQDQGVIPGQVQRRRRLLRRMQDTAGQGRAHVGLAHAPPPRPEDDG